MSSNKKKKFKKIKHLIVHWAHRWRPHSTKGIRRSLWLKLLIKLVIAGESSVTKLEAHLALNRTTTKLEAHLALNRTTTATAPTMTKTASNQNYDIK